MAGKVAGDRRLEAMGRVVDRSRVDAYLGKLTA